MWQNQDFPTWTDKWNKKSFPDPEIAVEFFFSVEKLRQMNGCYIEHHVPVPKLHQIVGRPDRNAAGVIGTFKLAKCYEIIVLFLPIFSNSAPSPFLCCSKSACICPTELIDREVKWYSRCDNGLHFAFVLGNNLSNSSLNELQIFCPYMHESSWLWHIFLFPASSW